MAKPFRTRLDPELLNMARRVVWFKAPEEALQDTVLFVNHVMIWGNPEDVATMRRHFDDDQLRRALRDAYPGIFDARSWAYWHCVLGMASVPPLPVRRLPGFSASNRRVRHWPSDFMRDAAPRPQHPPPDPSDRP